MPSLCLRNFLLSITLLMSTLLAGQVKAMDSDLAFQLMNQLGVTQQQAIGGAGAIFQLAQQRLTPDEFGQVSESVPDMDNFLNAAPSAGIGSSLGLGGVSGLLGGGDDLLGAGSLATSFSELGLSQDMVALFIPIVLDYVQTQGGEVAMNLLQGALN